MTVLARLLNSAIGKDWETTFRSAPGACESGLEVGRLTSPGPRQEVDLPQD